MVYDYYCVDCGNRLRAEDISFDLADLLGIKIENPEGNIVGQSNGTVQIHQNEDAEEHKFVKGKITQIRVGKLQELAQKKKIKLIHNTKSIMKVTLMDFLKIMGENVGNESGKGKILADQMGAYSKSQLADALDEVYGTNENTEVAQRMIRQWQTALENRFQLTQEAELFIQQNENDETKRDLVEMIQENTANYEAEFVIQPEYFEDGRYPAIYTIQYSHDMDAAFLEAIHDPLTIRGYCPICGQPVISGAGKYPHELIGMLGVQSAGKTSLIMALISELKDSFTDFQINWPGAPLCDSRYHIMQKNHRLYDNGWAVIKTNASSNEGTFNVSFRISNQDNTVTKLITLVDIAGEQCYDLKYNVVNQDAFKTYPLIGHCGMYLLCSCVDQTGYGNADGDNAFIPPHALISIAQQIYDHVPNKDRTPPLCLVMTKSDMASGSGTPGGGENPFDNLKPAPVYEFASQLENLRLAFATAYEENIREPLSWCKRTYDGMKGRTYVSMLTCSALGRLGERYTGNLADIVPYTQDGRAVPFRRTKIADLWKWIFQVGGLSPVGNTSRYLPFIPSYQERYAFSQNSDGKHYRATPEAMKLRCFAVMRLFINQSDIDSQIIKELNKERHGGILRRDPTLEDALEDLVKSRGIAVK